MSADHTPDASHNLFHLHLDDCIQCRNNPFNLCSNGDKLLHFATSGDVNDLRPDKPEMPNILEIMGHSKEEIQQMRAVADEVLGGIFGPYTKEILGL